MHDDCATRYPIVLIYGVGFRDRYAAVQRTES